MAENLSGMKADMSGLIVTWGKRCTITRLSTTQTASGRHSGSFATVASGTFVLQAAGDNMSQRVAQGLHAETTHLVYGRFNSTNIKAADRLVASGESYFYDVTALEEYPQHTKLEVKRVKKS